MSLMKISDLSIAYDLEGGRLTAVDGVSLEIGKKEFVAIVGESGCGKSTLALSIIGLLQSPPARVVGGSIEYKGTDLLKLGGKELRRYRGTEIAMIFQEPLTSLNPVYKVGDQIAEAIMIRDLRGVAREPQAAEVMQKAYDTRNSQTQSRLSLPKRRPSREVREEIVNALKLVRIADPEQVLERYPFELSGGMRQRVMIAMALSQRPSLLAADEPTTALDVTTQAQVLKLMKDLIEEIDTSILLITHDLAVASEVADRVVVMYAGEVVEDTDVFELFADPLHPYTKGLLSCIPTGAKDETTLAPIPGSVPSLSSTPKGCRFAARCAYAMDVCRERRPPLVEAKNGHKVACFLHAGK